MAEWLRWYSGLVDVAVDVLLQVQAQRNSDFRTVSIQHVSHSIASLSKLRSCTADARSLDCEKWRTRHLPPLSGIDADVAGRTCIVTGPTRFVI